MRHSSAAVARRRCRRHEPCVRRQAKRSMAFAKAVASAKRPPPTPSTPTKSVSQKSQIADARSASRARPEIAARESAKHRRAARVRALALQRVEHLFDREAH